MRISEYGTVYNLIGLRDGTGIKECDLSTIVNSRLGVDFYIEKYKHGFLVMRCSISRSDTSDIRGFILDTIIGKTLV